MKPTFLLFVLLFPSSTLFSAAPPELKVGDPAPPLHVGRWFTGSPLAKLDPGRVYVLEFWATWCAPCLSAMPHLGQLQAKHEKEGLTVIAVAVRDEAEAVEDFVAKRATFLNHPVAIDLEEGEGDGFMSRHWLEGSGREGVPWTFLVDRNGKIAWIGHPMRVDGPLAALLAGNFDPARQQRVDAAFSELDLKLGAALRENRWRDVLAVLDEMNRVDPVSTPLNHSTTVKALLQLGEKEAALQFARKAAEDAPSAVLPLIANELLKAPGGQDIDYDLAVRLCEQALRNGESGNPVALGALARSYEGIGKPTEAVRVWRQMLALDDPAIDKENVRERIDELVR